MIIKRQEVTLGLWIELADVILIAIGIETGLEWNFKKLYAHI